MRDMSLKYSHRANDLGVSVVSLLCGLLACTGLLGGDGHLRGTVEPSPDGGTYLQFDDDNGGEACLNIHVNGEAGPHPLGVPAEIGPGLHTVECGGALELEVPEGVSGARCEVDGLSRHPGPPSSHAFLLDVASHAFVVVKAAGPTWGRDHPINLLRVG